jgi:hypothetical protein
LLSASSSAPYRLSRDMQSYYDFCQQAANRSNSSVALNTQLRANFANLRRTLQQAQQAAPAS